MTQTSTQTLGSETIRWSLDDLYKGPNDPKIESDILATQKKVTEFAKQYRGKLASLSPKELAEALNQKEAISNVFYQVSQYVHLLFSTDLSNNEVKSVVARVEEAGAYLSNEMMFFSLELGQLDEATFKAWVESEEIADFSYKLSQIYKKSRYQLSEKEEQMIQLKDLTGTDANQSLYAELTSSFSFEMEVDGEHRKMNGSELRALRQHPNPETRDRAMKLFFDHYKSNKIVISHVLNTVIKDYNIERKKRGYDSAIQCMNKGNNLPDEVVAVLHEVTSESYSLVQRYYKIKAKLIGMDKLTLSDIYAPMPNQSKKYSWEEAKALVLDSFKAFDSDFYEMAATMFDEKRVDAPVQATKRGGAYCSSSVPAIKPYVFLNFLGRPRDISTMSHELGHAIHACLSNKQRLWNYHAILPLCETASVFSEMVLMDHMKKAETDPKTRLSMLCEKLEDIFATSHRQNMFSRFEMKIHKQIESGIMSAEQLCEAYKEELEAMFGDAVSIPDHYHWEWAGIPHIIDVPFYVYSYNFGNLLVMALYQQYLDEGEAFVPKLKTFLAAGSSDEPVKLTEALGVDITDAAFWRKSLRAIEAMVDELESLI